MLIFSALVEEMFEWVTEMMNRPSRHLTRFMAHLILFLQAIGANTKVGDLLVDPMLCNNCMPLSEPLKSLNVKSMKLVLPSRFIS